MAIKIGDEVKFHYTVKLEDGEVVETTRGGEPLSFTVGSERLLPGLEEAILGLKKGDRREVTIPPEKGFGERREELLKEVPKSMFKEGAELLKGAWIELRPAAGPPRLAVIHEVKEDTVVLDFNHPLAGRTLTFDIEIVDVTSK